MQGVLGEDETFKGLRRCALALTVFTGATGLVYEVAWHKYLANFFGSQAKAAALILAIFLGGLCVGYEVFGRFSEGRSPKKLLRMVAWIEVGIGIWAFAFPLLYSLIWDISGVLSYEGSGILVELTIGVCLIGVPTVLMGGTLPLLTQGLSKDIEDSSPFHAKVYAINTFGAFAGCLLSGFYLLPNYGLTVTMLIAAPLNCIAGFVFLFISNRLSDVRTDSETSEAEDGGEIREESPAMQLVDDGSSARHLSLRRAAVIALLAGFYSISLQVVLMRLVGLAVGSSEYAFCMIVAAFILMLAIGAWVIASGEKFVPPVWVNQLIAVVFSVVLYSQAENAGYWVHVVRSLYTSQWPNFYTFHTTLFVLICLILAVPVGAMGSTMPLLFGAVRSEFSTLGGYVGKLYSVNTVGCVLGALIGGYYLLFHINLDDVFLLCIALMLATVVLSVPYHRGMRYCLIPFAFLLICGWYVFEADGWSPKRINAGLFRIRLANQYTYDGPDEYFAHYLTSSKLLRHVDGPNTTVAITERPAGADEREYSNGKKYVRAIRVNGKSDGETVGTDMGTMRIVSHLPILLSAQEVKKVAVIGFGLGVSLGTAGLYPEVQDIQCIEISPAIKDVAHFFDFANHGVTKDPRISWRVGDAFRVLGGSEETYDAILSEPSNPWVTGVERVFARDFYEIIKSRLSPGGVYAQWFHTYAMSEDTFAMVVKTFSESFEHVKVFNMKGDVIFLGTKAKIDSLALQRMAYRYNGLPAVQQSLKEMGVPNPEALLATELPLPSALYRLAETHTLEFPKLAYAAGKDFFIADEIDLHRILSRRSYRPWARRQSTKLLIGDWLKQSNEQLLSLKRYAKAACRSETVELSDRWPISTKACKSALIALVTMGEIDAKPETPYGLKESDVELIRALIRAPNDELNEEFWQSFGAKLPIKEVETMIAVYRAHDSAFLPLSLRKLVFSAYPCLTQKTKEALRCRSELIDAIARNGYGRFAYALLKDFRKDGGYRLPKAVTRRLRKLVEQAVDAERLVGVDGYTVSDPSIPRG